MATAKGTTAKNKPANPPEDSSGVDNPALKKRWQTVLARYRAAVASSSTGWDDRYEALDEILHSEPPLYLGGGFRSAAKFLAAHAPGESARSIDAAILVARHFDPSDEAAHGVSKLELLVRYLEAVGGGPLGPAKIDLGKQKIRVPDTGEVRRMAFSEVTVAQLRAAARAASGKASGASKEPPAVKKVRAALGKAGIKDIAISVRGGKLTLSGIALEGIGKLGKALGALKG